MAIISMVSETREGEPHVYPEGTYVPLNPDLTPTYPMKGHPIMIRKWAVGCVLSDHERNGYNDSDFYCYYWDEENEKIEYCEYATTRGWTYPCYGTAVDATPEVRAKAEAWQKAKNRRLKAAELRRRREVLRELRATTGYSVAEFNKLLQGAGFDVRTMKLDDSPYWGAAPREAHELKAMVDEIRKLKAGSHRSAFRKSLAEQINDWVKGRAGSEQYTSPLSPRQLARLRPMDYSAYN